MGLYDRLVARAEAARLEELAKAQLLLAPTITIPSIQIIEPSPLIEVPSIETSSTSVTPKPTSSINWTREQINALDIIEKWFKTKDENRFMALTGAAGTGKTSCLKELQKRLEGYFVSWAATTGKAALRMKEVLGGKPTTLHSWLYEAPREERNEEEKRSELVFHSPREEAVAEDPGNKKTTKRCLIVDECFEFQQPILTEVGWERIGRIVEHEKKIKVWSRNPVTGQLELKPVIRWLKKEAPETGLLKINIGRTASKRNARLIRCTPDHKILTPNGYVCAKNLKIGDPVIVKGSGLTKEQRSILIGSLLGDGSMGRGSNNTEKSERNSPQPKLMLGEDQLEYLKFKHQAFGSLAGAIKQYKSGFENGKPVYLFHINVTDDSTRIAGEMPFAGVYENGRRFWSPTDSFLEMIDAQALAVWFLDNGSVGRSLSKVIDENDNINQSRFHTERFTEDDNQRFSSLLLKNFDIGSRVSTYRNMWYLGLGKDDTARLFEIIRPYVPACMSWKTGGVGCYNYIPKVQPETTVSNVRSIEPDKLDRKGRVRKHVYDLEVADFHNYVAGNVIVSNCSMINPPVFNDLKEAARKRNYKVLLVGDPYQLPPVLVGKEKQIHGDDFSVFSLVKGPELKEVHRNKGSILDVVTTLRETQKVIRENYEDFTYIETNNLVETVLERYFDGDREDCALITWTNALRMEVNSKIRYCLDIQDELPQKGEPVVLCKNSHNTGQMNGEVVYVESLSADFPVAEVYRGRYLIVNDGPKKNKKIVVSTDGRTTICDGEVPWIERSDQNPYPKPAPQWLIPISYGYCLTCHKAQGQEFRRVIVFLSRRDVTNPNFSKLTTLPNGETMPFFVRWLYTSLSRSREKLTLIVGR